MKERAFYWSAIILSIVVLSAEMQISFLLNDGDEQYFPLQRWSLVCDDESRFSDIKIVNGPTEGVATLSFTLDSGVPCAAAFRDSEAEISVFVKLKREDSACTAHGQIDRQGQSAQERRFEYRIPWHKGKRAVFWSTPLTPVIVSE